MINVAILGMGRIGKTHADAIRNLSGKNLVGKNTGVNLYALHDPFATDIQALAQKYDAKMLDYKTILRDDHIKAVLICTPTNQHATQIEDCVAHGKAVFCEKPIDLDIARVEACLQKVADHKGVLMVGFNRRFDPHFNTLKQQLKAGVIGKPELVQITSRDPAPPPISYIKNSGGLFKDMMIHDIDMARFLLDEELENVQAMGSNLVDSAIGDAGDVDTAILQANTKSGVLISITNSRRACYGYDQRIEVHGEKGMLSVDNIHEHHVKTALKTGFQQAPYQNFFIERYMQAYQNEITVFIEAINNNQAPSPNGNDGLASLKIAQLATDSLGLKVT
ncbi:MAG: inositol 2-dehydrogenase [Alphaproteobacteria bacterium]|nr:inositol 2-dehydrogenase [Alphaproteobacteria bacterium]